MAEDEVLLRMMALDVLTDQGFEVIQAGHAEEALAILELQAADIRVLVYRHSYAPPNGPAGAGAHHARSHWPWIALLLASGRQDLPKCPRKPVFVRAV